MRNTTNILKTLRLIYENEAYTASQIGYSNANQYLIPLENQELIIRKWAVSGKKRFKLARINPHKINEVKKMLGVDNV